MLKKVNELWRIPYKFLAQMIRLAIFKNTGTPTIFGSNLGMIYMRHYMYMPSYTSLRQTILLHTSGDTLKYAKAIRENTSTIPGGTNIQNVSHPNFYLDIHH